MRDYGILTLQIGLLTTLIGHLSPFRSVFIVDRFNLEKDKKQSAFAEATMDEERKKIKVEGTGQIQLLTRLSSLLTSFSSLRSRLSPLISSIYAMMTSICALRSSIYAMMTSIYALITSFLPLISRIRVLIRRIPPLISKIPVVK